MTVIQKDVVLPGYPRGFHLITDLIEKELRRDMEEVKSGLLHVFILHTSASLTINENADPTVREDFESHFSKMVPEDGGYFKHTLEGPDDMTSHIKASLLGPSVQIPVLNGRLKLGIWQGVYLCEHRNHGGSRKLFLSLIF